MIKNRKRSPGAGRPLTGAERKKAYNVMLMPSVAERLRELGEGNLSGGIAIALTNGTKRAAMGKG